MDKEFKTTFIPKKQMSQGQSVGTSKRTRQTQSILGLLAVLLFITSLVSVAGVYLYKIRLATVVNNKIDSINIAEKSFEPGAVLELRKLDIRLRAATELLENHVTVVDFFETLGETTLPDIQYDGLDINFSESVPSVSTSGIARGYLAIAQQSDLFEENRFIQNAIFSDFSKGDGGKISFSLSFSINPELLVYGKNLQNIGVNDIEENGGDSLNSFEDAFIEDQNDLLPAGTQIEFNQ